MAKSRSFALGSLDRDGEIAGEWSFIGRSLGKRSGGEGKNVRGLVFAAVGAIQLLNRCIAGQHDGNLTLQRDGRSRVAHKGPKLPTRESTARYT